MRAVLLLVALIGLAGAGGAAAQETSASTANYLGKWYHPAEPSGCNGVFETTFIFTGVDKGLFLGYYSISCINISGYFQTDGTLPSARMSPDGTLLVDFPLGTYSFNTQGVGEIAIGNKTVPLAMRRQ